MLSPELAGTFSASTARRFALTVPSVSPSFLACVSQTVKELRSERSIKLIEIAYWANTSEASVSRFEAGAQARQLDVYLAVYAHVCDVDAADILRAAVDRWIAAGGADELTSRLADGPLNPLGEIERRARSGQPRTPARAQPPSQHPKRRRGTG